MRYRALYYKIVILLTFSISISFSINAKSVQKKPVQLNSIPVYTYKIVNTFPHDQNAYTQGLVFKDNLIYEGTGLRGKSSLRKIALKTGTILNIKKLPSRLFGEGITLFKNQIIQLTWKSNTGFVYDADTFHLLKIFKYPTEGWGITHDGSLLIMSDGTSALYFLDPVTFKKTDQINVHDHNGPVSNLNELEFVKGKIYANLWQTDHIAIIDPQTGMVCGWIDLKGILKPELKHNNIDVLNGIAYDAAHDRLFVTGKLWPRLFEIKIVPKNP